MIDTETATDVEHIVAKEDEGWRANLKKVKVLHQILILGIIHLLYIFIEAFDKFEYQWISSVAYSCVAVGTLGFLWLQRANLKYLLYIPFISLVVVGGILEQTITTTVIFVVYCIYFFVTQFIEKKVTETIMIVILSGVSMIALVLFTLFNHGFVTVGYEFNVILAIWFSWCIAVLGLSLAHRKNYAFHLGLLVITLFFGSVGSYLGLLLNKSNLFSIFTGLIIFLTMVVSLTIVFLEKEFELKKFLLYIGINLVAIIVFSFSFRINFTWLSNVNKAFVIDYVLFIPLVIITAVVLSFKFYKKPEAIDKDDSFSYLKDEHTRSTDLTFLVTFFIFAVAGLLLFLGTGGNASFLYLKLLIISVVFVAATIPMNVRLSTTVSMISMMAFFVTTIRFLGDVSSKASLIVLLSIVGAILLFTIFNELFIIGEPLTTNLSIMGTLVGLTASILLFYLENVPLKEIWTSISWALIGVFLFAFGIIADKLFLRRSGLIVILVDIVYSLVSISISYRGWEMGVAYIILAIVLLICIYLFRWSEKRADSKSDDEVIIEQQPTTLKEG